MTKTTIVNSAILDLLHNSRCAVTVETAKLPNGLLEHDVDVNIAFEDGGDLDGYTFSQIDVQKSNELYRKVIRRIRTTALDYIHNEIKNDFPDLDTDQSVAVRLHLRTMIL